MFSVICMLAIAVACCSWTIAETEVFRSIREAIAQWAGWVKGTDTRGWKQKIAYLPHCYYCTSHYVATMFLALHPFQTLTPDWRGYIISLFSVVGVSAVYLTVFNQLRVLLRWGQHIANSTKQAEREATATEREEATDVLGFRGMRIV